MGRSVLKHATESGMSSESKPQSRWWEFYFLRYFMGSVVGLAIVMFLPLEPHSPFKSKNSLSAVTVKDLSAANIFLLSA